MQRPLPPLSTESGRAPPLRSRQALEAGLGELWASIVRQLELSGCPIAVTGAVPYGLPCPRHGHPAGILQLRWSHACHYHPYELAPTAA